jgi:hypothetical protein
LFYNDDNSIYFHCSNIEQIIVRLDQQLWIVRCSIQSRKIILCDNDYHFISYIITISILELFNNPRKEVDIIPIEWKAKVCSLFQSKGRYEEAFELFEDDYMKFKIAFEMDDLNKTFKIPRKNGSKLQWKQISILMRENLNLNLLKQFLIEAYNNHSILFL